MVWFYCDGCGDSIKKPKLQNHIQRCRGSHSFTCIDCSRVFDRQTVQQHTSCVSEKDKYIKGATKPGGYAQGGFFNKSDQGEAEEVVGEEFLTKGPEFKCTLCNIWCNTWEQLVNHTTGTKHQKKTKNARAKANADQNAKSNDEDGNANESDTKSKISEKEANENSNDAQIENGNMESSKDKVNKKKKSSKKQSDIEKNENDCGENSKAEDTENQKSKKRKKSKEVEENGVGSVDQSTDGKKRKKKSADIQSKDENVCNDSGKKDGSLNEEQAIQNGDAESKKSKKQKTAKEEIENVAEEVSPKKKKKKHKNEQDQNDASQNGKVVMKGKNTLESVISDKIVDILSQGSDQISVDKLVKRLLKDHKQEIQSQILISLSMDQRFEVTDQGVKLKQ
eukprot:TRINITY_DN7073_c0_g2_i1.p1 TRINITY_DN7073_c0_g2~~TRINITY_DN7073_c0_g2_i1.p1  ORF type:complete len:407 (-),score=55.27 TRINITY_DN7073_c0_g2_i1:161-1342(-)